MKTVDLKAMVAGLAVLFAASTSYAGTHAVTYKNIIDYDKFVSALADSQEEEALHGRYVRVPESGFKNITDYEKFVDALKDSLEGFRVVTIRTPRD